VYNEISGGTFYGPVKLGRNFFGLAGQGAAPPSPDPEARD